MESYLEELENELRDHQREITHLQEEREALRQEQNNMSFNAYNREYQNIINHLETETTAAEELQQRISSYRENYTLANNSIADLRNLRSLLSTTTDSNERAEINEEITAKEEELRTAMSILPSEMADSIRESYLADTSTAEDARTTTDAQTEENITDNNTNTNLIDTYYSNLETEIAQHQAEIDHLEEEREALRNEEQNMPTASYRREYENINNHLSTERSALEEAQNNLATLRRNYDLSNSSIRDLRNLRELLRQTSDARERAEINEEITAKEGELRDSINALPEDLADYVRNSFLGNNQDTDTNENNNTNDSNDTSGTDQDTDTNEDDNTNDSNDTSGTDQDTDTNEDDNTNDSNDTSGTDQDTDTNDNDDTNDSNDTSDTDQDTDTNDNDNTNDSNDTSDTDQDTDTNEADTTNTLSAEAQRDYDEITNQIAQLRQMEEDYNNILQQSIARFIDIFANEKERYEKDGPFDSKTLDDLQNYYMNLKLDENQIFTEAKRNVENVRMQIQDLEQQLAKIREMGAIAQALGMTYDEYKNITSILENNNIINDILEKKGLKDLLLKHDNLTPEEKQALEAAKKDIYKEIANFLHKNKDKNILDAINILYGIDKTAKKDGTPKSTTVSEEDIDNMRKNGQKAKGQDTPRLPGPTIGDQNLIGTNGDEDSKNTPNKKNEPPKPKNKDNDNTKDDPNKGNDVPRLPGPTATDTPGLPGPTEDDNKKSSRKRGLREIFGDLRKDLNIGRKDGQRYRRSNIKVSKEFVNELHSGNMVYNIIHVVPAVIKAPIQLLRKLSGKIMLGKEAKQMMGTLRERLDQLPAEDLETIFKEYRGNRINQERYPEAFNMVIEEKMSEYILGKVAVINKNIEESYKNVLYVKNLLSSIDENLRKGKMTNEEKIRKLEQRKALLKQAGNSIKYIREAKIEADNLLSGGLHGLSEDMKAAATKLNCVGLRFAKTHDMDQELEDKLMECEKRENDAIYNDDDEALLNAFIDSELLLSENTEISTSLVGHRSTGKKYYSPLAEQLDYRNDPFVRDLFTTIAVTSAAVSAYSTFSNMRAMSEQQKMIHDLEKNYQNFTGQVKQAGNDIVSKRSAFTEGMKAQANQDVLTSSGVIERGSLDMTDWGISSSAYHTADATGHAFYNDFFNNVQAKFSNVANDYSSGAIDQMTAMQELANISSEAHQTLANVAEKCLDILKPYAQTHPQFDLKAVQETMQYIVDNPSAIANMNQSMIDVQNIGDNLIALSNAQITTINSLPGNLAPTLLGAASAAALATRVSSTMEKTHKTRYGNEVTDMMEEYADSQYEDSEENDNNKTR